MSESKHSAADATAPAIAWRELEDFSLVLGGPLYQLFRKARLGERVEDHVLRRIVVICGIIWLPLLLLCLVEGTLFGGVPIPFIGDIETHVRLLLVVPLLLVAELVVHLRMRAVVAQFVERKLVPEAALERFGAAIHSAIRLRNSVWAELLLIAIIFPLAYYIRANLLALESLTWYARVESGRSTATLAGLWFVWISNPIFQFLLVRWYFRLFIWGRFLWQVSRIELALIPTHPDRNGGLGFLGASAYALSPLLAAHGASVAGLFANRIFYDGASLANFKLEIVLLVGLLMFVVLGPLCVFAPQILAAKRKGLREYGHLAAEYMREFDRRWLRTVDRDGEAMLGSGDIQSLADLGNAFGVIREMKAVPFGRDTFVQLTMATVIPFFPLLFTMFPLEEMLNRIIGAVF
ncbi:MAG: hypothetical protein NFCOHLIN_00624 [Gammaproteobacteria bacterium]|nr:hypothetical protein [Gammaproteobacteria bacterium]